MNTSSGRNRAILLIGPTGSGKTPLGELLEEKGLFGSRCFHFDFGKKLREIALKDKPIGSLTRADIDLVRSLIDSGALLEDEHFHIAEKILGSFIVEKSPRGGDIIVLNGLPRHLGQASGIDLIVDIGMAVYLSCSAETVARRIGSNAGGDRTGRVDDSSEAVKEKLKVFSERTIALLEHYRSRGAEIIEIEVDATTTAEDMRDEIRRLRTQRP